MKDLSALAVEHLKRPGIHRVSAGLYLNVKPGGTRSWKYRYVGADGKAHTVGLGPYPVVTLAVAREKALAQARLRDQGIDPLAEKRAAQTASQVKRDTTFRKVAEEYVVAHQDEWRSAEHLRQWRASLKDVDALLGGLPVADITVDHVLAALTPLWASKRETAHRTRGRIASVLGAAMAKGLRPRGPNPAAWVDGLEHLLSAKKDKPAHHAAMPYAELPGFLVELRRLEGIAPMALEFCILTAARAGEVLGARMDEIDLTTKVWTVPASRMKAKREHRVPLSARAVEILATVPRPVGNPYLFAGARAGRPIDSLLPTLRELRATETVHGMRSAFRDWCAEETSVAREIAEAALAHVVGDATETAYRRGDALERRRALMEAWAGYCCGTGAVVALRVAG